jgi:hypothetical protein
MSQMDMETVNTLLRMIIPRQRMIAKTFQPSEGN